MGYPHHPESGNQNRRLDILPLPSKTILAEVSTSRLRIKTVTIGLTLQNGLYTMWSFVLPYLFNPDKANLGAKVMMFIFGGLSVVCLVYLWFYQPETAGRT